MTIHGHNTTIGELIKEHGGEVKTGPFGTVLKASEYTDHGVPVISVGEIGHGEFRIHDRTPFVNEAVTTRLPEYVLQKNDIVFARKGSVERSALVGDAQVGWFLGSDGIRLRLPETVSSKFVRYWVASEETKAWLIQNSTGSTMASLNQATIKRLPIVLPPLEEQREIAAVLGALDDKIELNRKTAATLEEMARALYRSWFVDFDPVHAKAAGRAPAHMDAQTAALFPHSFGEDGLPKGWQEISLGAILEPRKGKSITKKSAVHGDVPVVAGGLQPAYYHNTFNVIGPVVTVSASGANAGFVRLYNQDIWASDCSYISHEQTKYVYSMYSLLASAQSEIYSMQQGAAQPHIYPSDLKRLVVSNPPNVIWDEYERTVLPIFQHSASAEQESRTLTALRDTLLPRLMSGELRVGEAKEQVAAVA
jgi:type I restriction enzyme, S subunit